jgi:YVTN family beta-propeller protein
MWMSHYPWRRRLWRWSLTAGAAAAVLLLLGIGSVAWAPPPSRASVPVSTTVKFAQPVGAPKAYVGLFKDNAVAVLDTDSKQVLRTIPVPAGPHGLVITPDGAKVFVSSDGASTVSVIDTATDRVVDTIDVGQTPHGLAISPDGRTAYVTDENSNDVSIVDLTSRRVVASVPVGNGPRKIAVQPGPSTATSPGEAPGGMAMAGMAMDSMPMTMRAQAGAPVSGIQSMTFNDHGTVDVRGEHEVDVEADDYYFEPTFLRGSPGQTLKLVVENESSALHNVSIPGLGVDTNVPPHASAEIELTFPQAGSTTFFCKFHTAIGMNGALLVGDATP